MCCQPWAVRWARRCHVRHSNDGDNDPLYMTIEKGVLTEILSALGAKVRWCACHIFGAQDHAAAAIAMAGASTVFASKGGTFPEYWWSSCR